MQQEKGLKGSTIWLMIITASIFDAVQIMFAAIGIGWLIIPVGTFVYAVWFWMHGLSFISAKRIPSLGTGALLEIITAGIFPSFTGVVARAAYVSRQKPSSDSINNTIDLDGERKKRRGGDEMKKAA